MSKNKSQDTSIANNKKARHDYSIIDTYEAGLALAGWEVKSLRAGKAQLRDSYVMLLHGEAWLIGAHFTPLMSASTHVVCEPTRDRKLLLKHKELDKLHRIAEQDGHTIVALSLYWKGRLVKLKIGTAKGKQQHDKRATIKERDWNRDKSRIMKER